MHTFEWMLCRMLFVPEYLSSFCQPDNLDQPSRAEKRKIQVNIKVLNIQIFLSLNNNNLLNFRGWQPLGSAAYLLPSLSEALQPLAATPAFYMQPCSCVWYCRGGLWLRLTPRGSFEFLDPSGSHSQSTNPLYTV